MRINVLGLGNIMFGDEGFGVEVIRYLKNHSDFPNNVHLIDGGTQGIYLLDYFESPDYLIVYDAIIPMNYDQKIYKYSSSELPAFIYRKMSSHQVGLSELFSLSRLHGKVPKNLTLIGVPPVNLEMGIGLSDRVNRLVKEAAELGQYLVARWLQN